MAKQKRSEKHIHVHHEPVPVQPRKPISFKLPDIPLVSLASILVITLLVYLPVFRAGFVWDDKSYIVDNTVIHSLDPGNVFSSYVMGNYHPFTLLALSIQFQLFGLNETGYHVINLLLHLVNVLLVYYSIFLLCNKKYVALVAALLFGIHPLHTESVAWISGLKDLLYTSFFLGAYIFYLKWLAEKQNRFYWIALLLFLFSLLSKAMAASFPVVLLLTDYFKERKLNMKTWVEKIPFLLLSIIFGVVAILAQQSSEGIQDQGSYSYLQRIIFACYGYLTYLWKFLLPVYQSAYYPYPIKSGENLAIQFYIYPLLLLMLVAFVIYSLRFTKKIFYGIGFFTVTVFLVLQLLPVGDAVMADRYSYVSSIGIFYLAGEGFNWIWNNKGKTIALALLIPFVIFFSVFAYFRNNVWKNGITLWTDVIRKFPDAEIAYNSRGGAYLLAKKYDEALADLNKVIQFKPDNAEALNIRAVIYTNKKRMQEALNDLNRAIVSDPGYADAYNNRGLLLMDLSRYGEALNEFNRAIQLRPTYAEAYYNRGLLFMTEKKYEQALKDYDKAIQLRPGYTEAIINRGMISNSETSSEKDLIDYNKAIEADPKNPQLYYSRGIVLTNLSKNTGAISDFNRSIELKADNAIAYVKRGDVFLKEKDTSRALNDYSKAIQLAPQLAEGYIGRGNISRDRNKSDLALADYNKAIALDAASVNSYFNRAILFIKEKNFEQVISDFSKVLELKGDSAMGYYNIGMAEYFLNRKDLACQDLQRAAAMGFQAATDAHKQFCNQ
jgi:tetratricopeptide (TPR) repeat protein